MSRRILRTREMADVLGITERSFANHYKSVPHIMIGTSVRFVAEDVINGFKVSPKRTPQQLARAMAHRGAGRCKGMLAERKEAQA